MAKIRNSKGDAIFDAVNMGVLTLLMLLTLLPFVHLLAISFSSQTMIANNKVLFWPKEFNLASYRMVFSENLFWSGLQNSIFATVVGTLLAMTVTTLTAYPLSFKDLKYRRGISVFFIITMLFSGGIIPNLVLMNILHLNNNIWVLVLPAVFNMYNILLVKNYFEAIPSAMTEAARIDGAGELTIFLKIMLPLAVPTLATVGLFFAVAYWNSYFAGVYYITKPALKPLQTYLHNLLLLSQLDAVYLSPDIAEYVSSENIRAATIFAATIPILVVYPFIQKHFVKGLLLGSDK